MWNVCVSIWKSKKLVTRKYVIIFQKWKRNTVKKVKFFWNNESLTLNGLPVVSNSRQSYKLQVYLFTYIVCEFVIYWYAHRLLIILFLLLSFLVMFYNLKKIVGNIKILLIVYLLLLKTFINLINIIVFHIINDALG